MDASYQGVFTISSVPEPGNGVLLVAGLAALAVGGMRLKRAKAEAR